MKSIHIFEIYFIFQEYWKLPVAYFLVRGLKHDVLAGIIRETLFRAKEECDIDIFNVTMDGHTTNVSAYESLGAKLKVETVSELKTYFPHPSDKADYVVSVYLDPIHMFKLIRTTLADYKEFIWPGHGTVKWIYIHRMHQLQEKHGIRLGGNKVNHRHINFRQNKMKANLAIQTMASRSVAVNLK